MNRILLITVWLIAAGFSVTVPAQERVSREDCLKAAFLLSAELKALTGTPLPTDPDLKRPVAVRSGEYGGLVLPECKLNAEVFSRAGKDPAPVGQLWLRKLAPMKDGQVMVVSKLRVVQISTGKGEEPAVCCALGVRKGTDGQLELLVYGKDKEPVVRVPLKVTAGSQENPIEMTAEQEGDTARVTLKLVGKYEASFSVGEAE
jgi:hypothetical protein